MNIQNAEQTLRELRAELQRRTGEDYCSVSIEGHGQFNVYIHKAGISTSSNLQEAIEAAVLASAPEERLARLRQEAEERLAAAAELEAIAAQK
ncbi:MAG TPA: hypothetical protein VF614_13540 [Chthoniobacteraceae bacterium]|jgi:hypothetical protein